MWPTAMMAYAYAKLLIINAGFVLPVDYEIPGVF